VAKLLDVDPELGEGLAPERFALASVSVRVLTRTLLPGTLEPHDWPPEAGYGWGVLVLDGLLLRRVQVGDHGSGELLGAGDLLRPGEGQDAMATLAPSCELRVLEQARVALLDSSFARRIAAFPEIQSRLFARSLRRAQTMAVNLAILQQPRVEARVQMLLWHLADRWGTVRRDGVLVPVKVTHTLLAELLAARRQTVTAALGNLQRRRTISADEHGWLLHEPPHTALARDSAGERAPRDGGRRARVLAGERHAGRVHAAR
jgi:CRP/FNR family transcriptional regulator, cyclic AMP receptor protein